MQFMLNAIGVVRSPYTTRPPGGWRTTESEILIEPEFAGGLDGLEGYSHLFVLFYFDRVGRAALRSHPRNDPRLPVVGIFATRCSKRPNPIGLTLVRLLRIEGHVLIVRGLDCYDGTPVLDLKPYVPPCDRPAQFSLPVWLSAKAR